MTKEECYHFFIEKGNNGIKPIQSSFSKTFPKIYEEFLTSDISKKDLNFSAKLFLFLNEIDEIPTCKTCGNQTKFKQLSFGFYEFCSKKCSAQCKETRNKCEATCLEKYGHRNIAHGTVREKIQQTFNERYGGHPFKDKKVKEKIQIVFDEKYGGHPFKDKKVKEKIQQTWVEKYGKDNPMKVDKIVKQTIQTKYDRGIYIDWKKHPELLEDYYWYKKIVGYFTELTFKKFYYEINPNNHRRSKNGWHLDHIYPIIEGWKNKVDPQLLANKNNLQILWCKENHGKSGHTTLTIENFYEMIGCNK